MNAPRRALLIVNRGSRRGETAHDAALEGLRRYEIEPLWLECASRDELSPLIAEHGKHVDLIVIGGGDGTLSAAASGVMQAKKPLGILPTGTANDLARTLAIPEDLDKALRVIGEGHTQAIDVGSVNNIYFFNVASIGLSAELARELTADLKRRFGKLGYAVAAIRVLIRARPFFARIITADRDLRSLTLQVAVGNGRFYGGGNIVTETAAIDDGCLDLYSLEFLHAWRLVLLLRAFRRGEHTARREVRELHGQTFEITTRSSRPVNGDGDIPTNTPAMFRVRPKAIEIFVPARRSGEWSNDSSASK